MNSRPLKKKNSRDHDLFLSVTPGLLLTIEVSAVVFGGGLSLPANSNWEQVPAALPVIIFTLVFHDLAPGTQPIPVNHHRLLSWNSGCAGQL
jgi:hypothetical protein